MSERYVLGNRIIAIKYVKTYGDSPRVSKQGTVFMKSTGCGKFNGGDRIQLRDLLLGNVRTWPSHCS